MAVTAGTVLAIGCSSDPNGGTRNDAKIALRHGPSRVLDGPYTWPSGATLSAVAAGPTTVSLSWPQPTGSGSVALFAVYQDGHQVASVQGLAQSAVVSGLTTGTTYVFAVQAVDAGGASTTDGPTATFVAVTPSASAVASAIDRSVATVLGPATSFLYTGPDPVQAGVGNGAILARQASVIQGHVVARDGSPLAGVLVTVVNHPEYGNTLSQADGEYDLAVNGGRTLRLHYALGSYLPSERLVQVPWQDYANANDVALVALDSQVTAVDVSSSSSTMQVARGTASSDASGTRQATLLVPPGTQATMTLADGSTTPLTSMSVRATEYSVGDLGNASLPADLPATSAYAYAIELTADEALAAGATKLTFSQPVDLYVEDFLNFPVGTTVPSGYYDSSRGAWVSAGTGLVLQIVAVDGSQAEIDINGDGAPDSGAALTALGITDAELQHLASLYSVGQKLWRTAIGHFTPFHNGPDNGAPPDTPDVPTPCVTAIESTWCGNYGCYNSNACGGLNTWYGCHSNLPSDCDYYCCPDGYAAASESECGTNTCDSAPPPPPPPDGPGNCQKEHASTIGCQRQSLGEDLPLAGTPYTLHYQSDWQRGYVPQVNVPVSAILGGSPTGIQLRASVAGRLLTQYFGASGGQNTTVTWDGRDAYGRLLQGSQPINVQINYAYNGVYQNAAGFGLPGNGTPLANSSARLPFVQTKRWTGTMESWDAQPEGIGGWTLNIHHTYDVSGRILRLGDGNNRTIRDVPSIVQTVVGNGAPGTSGDGGLATTASLTSPRSVALDSGGSIYLADGQSCVRKVGTDGIIRTFAGQCQNPGFSGDGAAASAAQLASPQDIAFGPDGSLYIADTSNQRVRRVDPNGIIQSVAGSGPTGATSGSFAGDGGQAAQATLNNPTGIDVSPDGTLYIADRDNGRIRQVSPDGIIATVAGIGPSVVSNGTGGAASAAALGGVTRVRVGPDGSIYIAETTGNVVRRIGSEGLIHSVVGTGTAGYTADGRPSKTAMLNAPMDIAFGFEGSLYVVDQNDVVRRVTPAGIILTVLGLNGHAGFSGDNGLATAATLGTSQGLRVGPDGSVYVASTADQRIRRVRPAFDGVSDATNGFQFPSEDGREVFVFDANGRHLRTIDALTGAALYTFAYDGGGRLASVTDVDGNVTQFNHDGAGHLVSIVSPYGQSSTFSVDSNGYLANATDPAGQRTQFTYDPNGLLQTKVDARGGLSQYTYDASGRLTLDQDPAGGSTALSRTDNSSGSQVTLTSATGLQTMLATSSATGALGRTNTLPTGSQSSLKPGPTSTTVIRPGRSQVIETSESPDPRFGMLAPVHSVTTTLPSGLSSTTATTRAATYANGTLATLTEQTNVNGSVWTRVFDAAARAWTSTSPAGRQSAMSVDPAGRPTHISIANTAPLSLTYDGRGRLATMSQGGATWTHGYDANGNLASVTDPLGRTISYLKDAVGRALTTTLPDSRQIGASYDGDNNTTQVQVPSAASHGFSFTPVNLLASYAPPSLSGSSAATLYGYDADRKLKTVTRPDGVVLTYGYDPTTGQHTSTIYPQGTLTLGYDAAGNVSFTTTPANEMTSFAYDGTLLTGTTWSGPVSGSLSLGFDNNFRMTSQGINGTALAFGYDPDGLLNDAGALALSLDPQNGRLTGTTLGSLTDSYSYDVNGRLASYAASYGGVPLYTESLLHDPVGRITQKTETVQGTTHVWGYTFDSSGRLTNVTEDGAFFAHYSYDANDNRTTYQNHTGTVSATYDAQDRLLTYGTASYAYTADGELMSKVAGSQTTSYSYDALGNLLEVTPPSGTPIDYVVDAQNRRVGKQVGGTLTMGFLYQDALNVVAQLDTSGNVVARYVFGTKRNVPDYFSTSAGTFRILSDHLGSPRLVVNISNGAVVQQIDYDEFGVVTTDTSPGLTPFGFAGGLYDNDTRLVRFGARDYDASVGRWTSKDPILFNGKAVNIYSYVGNDPIDGIDPLGLAGTFSCDIGPVNIDEHGAASFNLFPAAGCSLTYCLPVQCDTPKNPPVCTLGVKDLLSVQTNFCTVCFSVGIGIGLPINLTIPIAAGGS